MKTYIYTKITQFGLAPWEFCTPGAPLPPGRPADKFTYRNVTPADKFTCRQAHLPTSPPASQVSPGAKRAFDACTFLPLTPYCRDSLPDKTAARRTQLHVDFAACQLASVALCDGVTLVFNI